MDFWEIYDRCYARVRAYALSMLRDPASADDVVQETFLRAQSGLGGLREPEKLLSWLFRIAHNLCMDQLRARQASRIDASSDPESAGGCLNGTVERDLERGQMSACVRKQIDRLADPDRAVILLCDIGELSQQEIAEVLGIPVGTLKVRLHRARRRLRSVLEAECSFGRDRQNVLICEPRRAMAPSAGARGEGEAAPAARVTGRK